MYLFFTLFCIGSFFFLIKKQVIFWLCLLFCLIRGFFLFKRQFIFKLFRQFFA
ncbi:sortase B protein-sorting domain-containing protein [bacterium]|nr:sortase B protein-sorting domain-containing protein [bacterium]MBU1993582.1 sortase B protein-sorting domain-containing protein [bacterium]